MISILIGCLVLSASILIVATVWSRARRFPRGDSMPPGLRNAARMAGGPFSISVAIHLAIILALIITVHATRARDLIMVTLSPGSIGTSENVEPMELPEIDLPVPHKSFDDSPPVIDTSKPLTDYSRDLAGTTSPNGMSFDRNFGGYLNTHPGSGSGGGMTFPWYLVDLRHKGLDVVIVIDGTKSMDFVMEDVKARMAQLAVKVRHLVPIARVGVVVFGGKGEPLSILPLTMSTAKLQTFLQSIQARGGGEWEENTLGALQAAFTRMDWKPYARKVIVLIGDSPPEKNDFAPLVSLIHEFRRNNGTLSAIDVQQEEHERFERAFWMRVHGEAPKSISPLPEFALQAQAAYKMITAQGGGSVRSLSRDADLNHQAMILIFGDKWQDEISRFASR